MKEVKEMKNGLTQVYCGNGKGKTTAAIGLGIRAIGNHMKVIMIQFLKNNDTGECELLKQLEPNFKVFHFEKNRGFTWSLSEEEKNELKQEIGMAIKFAKKVMDTDECDVLILDEILAAVQLGYVSVETLIELVESKSDTMELVLTGRELPEEVAEHVDYISNIQAIKHPMEKGIDARKGIEY